jgi:drug/metabolite transporter (DMT)-like permease
MTSDTSRWLRLMLIAFVTNGLGPFGLKVLAANHFGEYEPEYLIFWYVGGLVFAAAAFAFGKRYLSRAELLFGSAMGFCSLGGQFFTGEALTAGVPGYVAFPITTGGSLFLVALAGILLFKERVGPYGLAGLAVGILALVILSI